MDKAKSFYDKVYKGKGYATANHAEKHSDFPALKKFIEEHGLKNKKCLEVGCGRGAFQDLVTDYTGLDISRSLKTYMRKPFVQGVAPCLPFGDDRFDAIWSIHTFEHVYEPELALSEMCRVLKPCGLLYLAPAWQCRPWAAEGYPVRPYSDFDLKGKMIKASILVRDTIWYRSISIFPKRAYRLLNSMSKSNPTELRYVKLNPNYDVFWMSDSDAVNAIDPYEVLIWFRSRGHECLSYTTRLSQFLVRTGPIVFQINK